MSSAEITGYAGTVIAVLTAIIIPAYLRHQGRSDQQAKTDVVSWKSLTSEIKQDRDRLQVRLDKKDAEHGAELRALAAEWQAKLDACSAKIALQQAEIDNLYRRLGKEK